MLFRAFCIRLLLVAKFVIELMMLHKIILSGFLVFRSAISRRLNTVLVIAVVVGMLLPGLENTPDIYVPFMLGIMVFFLCSKMSVAELSGLAIPTVLLFYVLRFLVFPLALYALALVLVPSFAIGILLIALVPVGVTTPTLVGSVNGNVALAFVLTVASSLLAPFVIPAVFLLIGSDVTVEVASLSSMLFAVVFIPSLLYILIVKITPDAKASIERNSAFVPVLLLGIIVAIVISKQKTVFLNDINLLFVSLILSIILFYFLYLFGWLFNRNGGRATLLSYALCSGANNNALAISLALVYFPSQTVFFVIVSELVWVLAIPVFNHVQKKRLESVALQAQ